MRKHRWACERVDRIFTKVTDTEMRQRLAEILELLLTSPSQLQRQSAFSRISRTSSETPSRLATKRKGRL
jgi:hypothetical protein